eukprot:scaffold1691_cov107-Isochrysis_galbana.AAC.4
MLRGPGASEARSAIAHALLALAELGPAGSRVASCAHQPHRSSQGVRNVLGDVLHRVLYVGDAHQASGAGGPAVLWRRVELARLCRRVQRDHLANPHRHWHWRHGGG